MFGALQHLCSIIKLFIPLRKLPNWDSIRNYCVHISLRSSIYLHPIEYTRQLHFRPTTVFLCWKVFSPSVSARGITLPGLTSQRQSALINSDSEIFQFWFSAVHYLIISGQRRKQKFSELKISTEKRCFNSDFLWNLPDSQLNCVDFWRIQNDNFKLMIFSIFFWKFQKYLNFEAHYSAFQPNLQKEVNNKN